MSTATGINSSAWHLATVLSGAAVNIVTVIITGIAYAVDSHAVTNALFAFSVILLVGAFVCTTGCALTSTKRGRIPHEHKLKVKMYELFALFMHILCILPVFMWIVVVAILSRWETPLAAGNYFVTGAFYGDGYLTSHLICVTIIQFLGTLVIREWGPNVHGCDDDPKLPSNTASQIAKVGTRTQGWIALTVPGIIGYTIPVFWTRVAWAFGVELGLAVLAYTFVWIVARQVIGGSPRRPRELVETWRWRNAMGFGVGVVVLFLIWCCVRTGLMFHCLIHFKQCMYPFFLFDIADTLVTIIATAMLAGLVYQESKFYAYATNRKMAHEETVKKAQHAPKATDYEESRTRRNVQEFGTRF